MKKILILLFLISNLQIIYAQKIPKTLRGEWRTEYILYNPYDEETTQHKIHLHIDKNIVLLTENDNKAESYFLKQIPSDEKIIVSNQVQELQIQTNTQDEITLSFQEKEYHLQKTKDNSLFEGLPTYNIPSEKEYLSWWQTYEQVLNQDFSEKKTEILNLQEGGLFLPNQNYFAWQVIERTFLVLNTNPISSWWELQTALNEYGYPKSVGQILRLDTQKNEQDWNSFIWIATTSKNIHTPEERFFFRGDSIFFEFYMKNIDLLHKRTYSYITKQSSKNNTGQIIITVDDAHRQNYIAIPFRYLESENTLYLFKGLVFDSFSDAQKSMILLDSTNKKSYESEYSDR